MLIKNNFGCKEIIDYQDQIKIHKSNTNHNGQNFNLNESVKNKILTSMNTGTQF